MAPVRYSPNGLATGIIRLIISRRLPITVTSGYRSRKHGLPKPYVLPTYLMPVNPWA